MYKLQDIAGASSQPLMTGDSLHNVEAGGNIYFLESEADLFNLSYVAPAPDMSGSSGDSVALSPSYSLSSSLSPSSSSYSSSSLSPSSSSYSEYSEAGPGGQNYTININLSDIENQVRYQFQGYKVTTHCRPTSRLPMVRFPDATKQSLSIILRTSIFSKYKDMTEF